MRRNSAWTREREAQTASGQWLPCLGTREVVYRFLEGGEVKIRYKVMQVQQPLLSVGMLVDQDYVVH